MMTANLLLNYKGISNLAFSNQHLAFVCPWRPAEGLFKGGASPGALEVIISLFPNGIMPNR